MKRILILIDAEVGFGKKDEDCIKMASYMHKEFNVHYMKIFLNLFIYSFDIFIKDI